MKTLLHLPRAQRTGLPTAVAVIALGPLLVGGLLVSATAPALAASAVTLGTAESFVVLAGSGITNTGATTLSGDLGTYPTTTITGSGLITFASGSDHGGDRVTQQAKSDLDAAYGRAASQATDTAIVTDLGGQRLTAGVYTSASTIGLTGELTLDGGGQTDSVFVFQAGSSLTTASASRVRLVGGAQACNVFWQIDESATLGTGSTFRGSLMAHTSITVTTGVTVEGRVLARGGAVTLDNDVITAPVCATATGGTSPSASPATSAGPSTSASPSASPVTGAAPAGPGVSDGPSPSITPPGTTSRQITAVPTGSVDTGDGSASGAPGAPLAATLILGAAAATAATVVRRRRTAP